jgi:uncharacterized protein (TIGR03437 family)
MLNPGTLRNRRSRSGVRNYVKLFASLLLVVGILSAQPARTTLTGHIHPLARPENDQGRVSPALQLSYVTVTLAQSASRQASLDQLLAEQQTPGSPNYHRWITPEDYAQRFGASPEDVNRVVAWLQSQGLDIAAVARGRGWVAVNGAAANIENAFQTELHQYMVHGETYFANAADPSVPAELGGIVKTVSGLHNFRLRAAKHSLKAEYTSRGSHFLAPNDFATIYDVMPLYAAGINGSGQKLVILGDSGVNLSDITTFRSTYGLPLNDPQIVLVPGTKDPGITGDLDEADLDLEWSGAVARNATIIYVYASDQTFLTQYRYVIDNNLAPVMSSSYGSCEQLNPTSEASSLETLAKQGNSQGMTWINSAGDSGGADCYDSAQSSPYNPGLAVDFPGSIPEVTDLGGTEFSADVAAPATYWNTANDANQASARSYIPETVWNDSALEGQPAAGGGGVSIFYAKPSWQTGPGVPSDNVRHVPDVSLNASNYHDTYLFYSGGLVENVGGTSFSAPCFAGIATLLNQYLVSIGAQPAAGLGNMNAGLYSLAQSTPAAFHDITTGNNIVTVTCPPRTAGCVSGTFGYSATVGYDNASGLGSVDAYNLVMGWGGAAIPPPPGTTGLTLLSNLTTLSTNDTIFMMATATGANGVTPAGVVVFEAGNASLGSVTLVGSAGIATATLAVNGSQLSIGSVTITATYTGSSSVTASVTLGITPAGGTVEIPAISGFQNSASFVSEAYAPGMLITVYGSQLAPSAMAASSVPLPLTMNGVAATVNGEAAPLSYVSAGQFNIQIPYETASGTATLKIDNNGQVTSQTFSVAGAAPGIYTQNGLVVTGIAPEGTATRGQVMTLYMTGGGSVTPGIATGAAPAAGTALANLPQPTQTTTVTVGGVAAPANCLYCFIGMPTWAVGVIQINFQVPTGIGIGSQPVVVTVGNVASTAAMLSITN